ncbi:hypothetical protein [Undibacterium fentianense]|uniref:Uncharacterized protein n=1 Tax=Undibacterium fentianense TaxID=2828728 RepID=A0A941IH06_9BURK|nr:hypothetical protein [Undibacterium fentianense]MBR7800520.1 hypothetical protein [Undibacterium fentianense]
MNSHAQLPLVPEINDQHPLVQALKPCVSAIGLQVDLPLANPVPVLSAPGHLYQLNELGRIRDGYRHSLYVSADQQLIYIVQVGGLAGTSKIFGPVQLEHIVKSGHQTKACTIARAPAAAHVIPVKK